MFRNIYTFSSLMKYLASLKRTIPYYSFFVVKYYDIPRPDMATIMGVL